MTGFRGLPNDSGRRDREIRRLQARAAKGGQ